MRRARRQTRQDATGSVRRYFTDGGRLYRFVEWVVGRKDSVLAVVEDCGSLELLIVRPEQLNAWREVASAPPS